MIITRTPFRIPLGGGGTDLPSFYQRHGGFIFSAAINKYMYIAINRPAVDKLIRVKYSKSETVDSLEAIQHDLVREALRYNGIKDNIEISSMADVPEGTGLGSSGSYLVGLLKGLHELKNKQLSVQELAEEACHIEINILKKPVGKQDQYLAAFGGFTAMDILKNGRVKVVKMDIPPEIIKDLESNLVLYFTGISRDAMSILGEQSAKAKVKESEVEKCLKEIKDIGIEIKYCLNKGNLNAFGKLMDEHWRVKRRMSDKISNPRFDELYELAKKNGVLGGKIMGAGGGGFFLFYYEGNKSRLNKIMAKKGLFEMPFSFEPEGSKILANFKYG